MNSTQLALKRFTATCLREARAADLRGDRRMAAGLRLSVSDVLAEQQRAMPAPAVDVDPETAKRQELACVWAQTIANGLGRPPYC